MGLDGSTLGRQGRSVLGVSLAVEGCMVMCLVIGQAEDSFPVGRASSGAVLLGVGMR